MRRSNIGANSAQRRAADPDRGYLHFAKWHPYTAGSNQLSSVPQQTGESDSPWRGRPGGPQISLAWPVEA